MDIVLVAKLAGLKLSEREAARFAKQLEDILSHFERIDEVDTEVVEPLIHPIGLGNVTREDCKGSSIPRQEMLSNAPDTDGENYITPQAVQQ